MRRTMRALVWNTLVLLTVLAIDTSPTSAQQPYAPAAPPTAAPRAQQPPTAQPYTAPRQGQPGQPAPLPRQAQAPANPAQPQPAAQQQPQQQQPPAPHPQPFPPLTAAEQADLDVTLSAWEKATQKIKYMHCKFTRWEDNLVFKNKQQIVSTGEIKYRAPDKGMYRVDPKPEESGPTEHWICDGVSVFEFDAKQKLVIERVLPRALQGKAIVDGPLPFLFSADAAKLKQRYWLRIVTPEKDREVAVWIQAFPRHQPDAANFRDATMILRRSDMQATHLQVVMPGGKSQTVHAFTDTDTSDNVVKNFLAGDFAKPKLQAGWKLVQAKPPVQQEPLQPQQQQPPTQARVGVKPRGVPAPTGPQ